MDLRPYLEAIKNCKDATVEIGKRFGKRDIETLTHEFGIYDNWPILLKGDREGFLQSLISKSWKKSPKQNNPSKIILNYEPGTILMQFLDFMPGGLATFPSSEKEIQEHHERQMRDYNFGLVLHPYQEKKMVVLPYRAMSFAIEEIASIMIERKTPGCFPRSIGWKNTDDLSQIVYYNGD